MWGLLAAAGSFELQDHFSGASQPKYGVVRQGKDDLAALIPGQTRKAGRRDVAAYLEARVAPPPAPMPVAPRPSDAPAGDTVERVLQRLSGDGLLIPS